MYEEISTQKQSKDECDEHALDGGDGDGGQPGLPVGSAFFNPVNNVEAVLNCRKAYRSGPNGGYQIRHSAEFVVQTPSI